MLHKYLFALVFLCYFVTTSAQDLNDPILDPGSVIPSSPSVANLIDFEEIPVNYYTGQPNITLPLYSKRIAKDLNIDLQLGYSSNGVKINSRSGWAGTGWSLSGLGVISKTVNGVPDEMTSSHAVGLWHAPLNGPFDLQKQWKAYGESGKKYDSQYDVFNAVYPGGSVEFILINQNDTISPVIINSSNQVDITMDIDFDLNSYTNETDCTNAGKIWSDTIYHAINTPLGIAAYIMVPSFCYNDEIIEINSFTIHDASGKSFVFDKYEYTSAAPITGVISQGFGETGSINAGQNTNFYTTRSAWHLTGIYDGPVDSTERYKLVDIEYAHFNESYTSSISYKENTIDFGSTNLIPEKVEYAYNKGILKPAREVSFFSTSTDTAYPSKITFRDSTYLAIAHEGSYYHPETNGAVLRTLSLYDRGDNLVKSMQLDHEITTGNNRLWLTGLEETNQNSMEKRSYALDYNQKENLPAFDSPKDIWGFIHQGDESLTGKPSDPIQTGLLTSIEFPTGGKKEFTWEHHRFSYAGTDRFDVDTQISENPNNYVSADTIVASQGIFQAIGTPDLLSHTVTLPELIDAEVSLTELTGVSPDANNPYVIDEFNTYVRIENHLDTIVFNARIADLRAQTSLAAPLLSSGT